MPPDDPEIPASPLPPDPFAGIDIAYATIVSQMHGLQRNGANVLEAGVFSAALAFLAGMSTQPQQPPG